MVVGCAGLLAAYAAAARLKFSKRALLYLAGVIVLLLTLVSPPDTLSALYSFSGHMIQHMLLLAVFPPLFLLGAPPAPPHPPPAAICAGVSPGGAPRLALGPVLARLRRRRLCHRPLRPVGSRAGGGRGGRGRSGSATRGVASPSRHRV